MPKSTQRCITAVFLVKIIFIIFLQKNKELALQKLKKENEQKYEIRNMNDSVVELSEGVRKATINKDNVKPVPYLPDDFLVYEIPETNSYTPTAPVARYLMDNICLLNLLFSFSIHSSCSILVPLQFLESTGVRNRPNTTLTIAVPSIVHL